MSADVATPRPRLRPRLPWLLLALSLALNICFIGGVLWVRAQAARGQMAPAERFEHVSQQLSLNADQHAAFERFIRALRMRTRQMHETNHPLIEEAWSELAKAQPDDAVLNRVFTESANNRRAYQLDTSQALRGFLAVLTDAQRARFVELARNREDRSVPPLLRQLAP
ncbi:MAG: periplasmic heavy metal sensor [Alphaproteobacteria bacterium]|nr:periplasmic heavy metal sensor [Alphaproteobacteria bacterium]